jgi:hypothetical protein
MIPFSTGSKMAEYKIEEENGDTSNGDFMFVNQTQ